MSIVVQKNNKDSQNASSLHLPRSPAHGGEGYFAGSALNTGAKVSSVSSSASIHAPYNRAMTPLRSVTPSSRFRANHYNVDANETEEFYFANPLDPLDVEIGIIINSRQHLVTCERVDLHLNKAAAEAQGPGGRMARYRFGCHGEKELNCKLIDRGDHKGKKVLCKVGGGAIANRFLVAESEFFYFVSYSLARTLELSRESECKVALLFLG